MTKGHSYHLSIIKNIVSPSIVAGDGKKIMDLTGGEAVSLGLHPSVITFMRNFLFFLRFFFSCGPFLVYIEFVAILLLFYVLVFLATRHMASYSLTRDQTHNPCTGRQSLNHWTTREVPVGLCFYCTSFSVFLSFSFFSLHFLFWLLYVFSVFLKYVKFVLKKKNKQIGNLFFFLILRCFHKQSPWPHKSVDEQCENWDIDLSPSVLWYRTWERRTSLMFEDLSVSWFLNQMSFLRRCFVIAQLLSLGSLSSLSHFNSSYSHGCFRDPEGTALFPGFLRSRNIVFCRRRSMNPRTRNQQFWFWHLLTVESW